MDESQTRREIIDQRLDRAGWKVGNPAMVSEEFDIYLGKEDPMKIREPKAKYVDHQFVDYLLLEALYEAPQYGLLVMGQTDSIGCFCPLNTLLRSTIKTIASQYDVVIIDAEAGFEQISRHREK